MLLRPDPRAAALCLAALVLIVDQVSKQWALSNLGESALTLPGPVDLTLVLNYSNAFGVVPSAGPLTRWGLAIVNLSVAAWLSVAVVRGTYGRLTTTGLALIAAGATGNALDRVWRGAVVDLFDASRIGFVWVFNVADVAIDVGIGLAVLSAILPHNGRDPKKRSV